MSDKNNVSYYKDLAISFLGTIVKPKCQVVIIAAFVLFLSMVFAYSFSNLNIFENRPLINPIIPQEVKGLETSTAQVKVGLHINDFPDFNMRDNVFVFDANIWFLFDPSEVSLETIERFSFSRGNILQKSLPPETKLIDGNYFVQYSLQVKFNADLNHKFFPFDDHRLYIEMTNKYVTPKELAFSSSLSSFLISNNMFLIGWKPVDMFIESGFTTEKLDKFDQSKNVSHPKVLFAIDFRRVGIQGIFLIFLPLCLMVFIGLFSFSLDPPKMEARISTLALTSITGLMGYRFVLQSLTPQVGYLLLSDCLFLLFLAVLFIIFCTGLIIIRKAEMTPGLIVFRGLVFIFSYMLLVTFTCYFLFFWPYS